MSPKDFIAAISDAARDNARETGIPASFTVAEAALESGWGAHAPGMNLFGIKADAFWTGPTTTQRTREFVRGEYILIDAKFRAYSDWLGSISDHASYLTKNPRYAGAFRYQNGVNFADAIAAAGYATDPDYATKIRNIIQRYSLTELDGLVLPQGTTS